MRTPTRPLSTSLARFTHVAAVWTALSLASSAQGADLTWDPDLNPGNGILGGAGSWDTTSTQWFDGSANIPWTNAGNHTAIFTGASGTVSLAGPVTAGGLVFQSSGYTISDNLDPLNILTLGGATPTISVVDPAHSASISASLTAASGFTKAGGGTLVLSSGGNTIGGPINLTGGTLSFLSNAQIGNAGTFNFSNNATLSYQDFVEWQTGSRVFDIGSTGGTLHSTAAVRMMADGQLTGSGTLVRTGDATNYGLDIRGNNTGFTGNVVVQSGTLEVQNSNALGTGTNQTISVSGGILSITKDISHKVIVSGGTLAFNNASTSTYKGAVQVSANSQVQLADFYQNVGRSGAISGELSGTGNLTVTSPASLQTLTLRGDTSGFTGDLVIENNAVVSTTTGVAGGTGTLGAYDITLNGGTLQVTPAMGSNPLSGQSPGLRGQYYNQGVATHNNNTGGVDYTLADAVRIDNDLDLRLLSAVGNRGSSEGVPTDIGVFTPGNGNIEQWAAQWNGLINITAGGDYTFVSSSDDASAVFIDGVRVVSNEGGHGFPGGTHRGTTVSLTPGQHSITVRLTQGVGGGGIVLAYEGPDQQVPLPNPFPASGYDPATLVPASVLSNATVAGTISNRFTIPDFMSGGIDATGLDVTSTGDVSVGFLGTLRMGSNTGHSVNQSGNVILSGDATISTQLQLSTAGTASNSVISGVISETAPARVTKTGLGTLTLTGANTFTGPFDVNQGRVVGNTTSLNTDISLIPGTSVTFEQATNGTYSKAITSFGGALVVKSGEGTLNFTQNIGASLAVTGGTANAPAGVFGDAAVSSGGTLVLGANVGGNLFAEGGALTIQAAPAAISVGSLSLNGGSLNLTVPAAVPSFPILESSGQLTLGRSTVLNLGGTQTAGVYKLIDYSGVAVTPQEFHSLSLGSVPTGNFYGILVNNEAGTSIDYTVEAFGALNTWTGQTDGVWNTATATNWSAGAYANGQQATFDDTGLNKTVSGGVVSPQRITFNNSAGNDYTISNAITGTLAGGIVKMGGGNATLSGPVSSAGKVSVNGGTLKLTNTDTAQPNSITGVWTVAANGTVEAAFGGTRTGTGTPSGSNALGNAIVDLSGGTLVLSGKDYDGGAGGLTTQLYVQQVQRNAKVEFRDLSSLNALFNTSTPETLGTPNAGLTDIITTVDFANGYGTNAAFAGVGVTSVDNVMATWRGQFIAPTESTYTFAGRSDDGMMVYIDGKLVLNRNNFQGTSNTSSSITLTPGRHDIFVSYYEGGGGSGVQLFEDAAGTDVMDLEDFVAAQPVTTLGNDVRWNASSTIAADNTYGVILGNLAANTPGTTLTSGRIKIPGEASGDGIVRFTDTDFNASGTYTINAQADIGLGTVRDGTQTITLVKTGPGNLILDSDGSAMDTNGTTISIQEGRVVASRTGAGNPLGAAAIHLDADGAILQLNRTEGVTGNAVFFNPVKVNANARIETARHGGGGGDIQFGNAGGGITIASGKTLEIHATSGGNLLLDAPISGDATVRISDGSDPGQSQGFVLMRTANTFTGPLIVENGGNVRIDNADALKTQAFVSLDTNARLEFYAANAFSNATPRILSKPGSFFRINSPSNPAVSVGEGTLEIGAGRIVELQSVNPYAGDGIVAKAINSYYASTTTLVPFQLATTQVGLRASDVRPLDVFRVTSTLSSPGAGVVDSGWAAMPAGAILQIALGDRTIANLAVQEVNGQILTTDGTGRSIVDSTTGAFHINEKGAVFTASGGTLTVFENIQTDAQSGRVTIGAHIPIDNRFSNSAVSFANANGGIGDFTGTTASAAKAVEVIGGAILESRVSSSGDSGLGSVTSPSIGVNLQRGSIRAYQPSTNLTTDGTYSMSVGKVFTSGAGTLHLNRNTSDTGVITEIRLGSAVERSAGATLGLLSQANTLGVGERIRFNNNADAPARLTSGAVTMNMVAPHFVNVSGNIGSFVDYDPTQDAATGPGFVNATYEDVADETGFGSGKIVNTTGAITLSADQSAGAVRLQGNVSGNFTLTSETGGFILTSSAALNHTISSKLAALPGKEFVLYSGGPTGGFHTINGTITSDSGFVKFGPRTLSLGADNSATLFGDIYINEASLVVGADNRLGAAANKVVLNGGNLRPNQNFTIPREIIVNAGGGQLTNDGNRTIEYAGVISGAGGLTINSVNGNNGINRLTAANTFEGGLIINNGILEVSSNDQLGALPDSADYDRGHVVINDSNTNATLRLADGAGAVSTGDRQFTLLGAGAKIDVAGADDVLTIANDIRGTGGLNKNGAGVLVLSNPEGNGYLGNTVVNAGALVVNNAQFSATGAGSVTVNAGATFAGNGVVEGAINVASGATLAPGASLGAGISGQMRTQNGLSLAEDAVFEWSLSALSTADPGTNFDRVIVDNGDLSIVAGADFRVNFGLGVAPSADAFWSTDHIWSDVIQVISLGTIASTGSFDIDNTTWAQFGSFSAVAGEDGYDVIWTTAVPEPASAITLLAGVGGLLGLGRFRRRS